MRSCALAAASSLFVVVALGAGDAKADDYDPHGADGLRADLERIVTTEEATGWFRDQSHYESMHAAVLQSMCRATPAARNLLADRLASERAVLGDARALFEAAGKTSTAAVDRALHLERMHVALLRGIADGDACPFWIAPERGYQGRQTDRNRITLNAETGGLLMMRYSAERFTIGFGTSFRLLVGRGFDHVTILAGPELSGGAMLRDDDSSKFLVNYFPALPVVVRIRYVNWNYSVETGMVSLLQGGEPGINFGVRAGFGIGFMALANRFFIPYAGISAYQEHYFANGNRPAAEYFRGGLRVGIIYDP